MQPDLTIVLPLHNGQAFLRATLQSVADERPEGVRFLTYDSSDDGNATASIVNAFTDRLDIHHAATPHIKPWQDKVNLGFEDAATPYVAILHQDDLWLPGHLAAIRKSLRATPQAVLSIGPSRFIDAQGRDVGAWRLPFAPGLVNGADFAATLIVQNTIAVPSVVYSRQAWLAAGGMDHRLWYTPDWDIYLSLARLGDIAVRPEATTAFRLHGSSLTMSGSTNIDEFRQQQELVLNRHADFGRVKSLPSQAKRAHLAIKVNCALALAANGQWSPLVRLFPKLAGLGPFGLKRFFEETRLTDRVRARIPLLLRR